MAAGMGQTRGGSGATPGRERWGEAILKAAALLLLAYAGFAIVPDRLLAYLTLHVSPRARDGLVVLWTVAFFIVLTWIFVAIQRWRVR
jgi:hypothetical protein